MTTDTDSGKPVYYYRGNVDNHVLFANMCWRIVRTTETGGVKLIYNGTLSADSDKNKYELMDRSEYSVTNDTTYPYVYDNINNTWKSNITDAGAGLIFSSIDFSGFNEGYYKIEIKLHSDEDDGLVYVDNNYIGNFTDEYLYMKLNSTSVVRVVYFKYSESTDGSDYAEFNLKKVTNSNLTLSCNNTGFFTTIGSSRFNSTKYSPATVGYMYGATYTRSIQTMSKLSGSIVFGNDVTYTNGTYTLKDTYTLSDVSNWSSEYSTIASKYHYTCFTSSDTCATVNYIHDIHSNTNEKTPYYFKISGGKNHLDILKEMLDNSSNENDSAIKTTIDAWYKSNMTDYTSQLEDTVFCNDRSYDAGFSTSGWNKDYSNSDNDNLYFNSYQRMNNSYKPTLICVNNNDKFTVESSNGNGALTYPVGLLTTDEMTYAGGTYNYVNSSYYLYNDGYQYSMSPGYFVFTNEIHSGMQVDGSLGGVSDDQGVRPVISLKPKTEFTGGSGTATEPFIIK